MEGNGISHSTLHDPAVLGGLYALKRGTNLAAIAAKSATVVDTLVEVRARIRQCFGKDREPVLSLESDPENGNQQIVVGIPVSNLESDFQMLGQFDGWWAEAWSQETADVCVTLAP